ncbi:MAG TPA: hypothetical protein VF548_11910 [Allosphingosinicella sp.]|jgi:hypothetical protein
MQSLVLSALLAAATPAAGADESGLYLLSIADVPIAGEQRVTGFKLASWGVDWVALCAIPTGWRLRAGRNATPEGLFEGESTHGVTWLGSLEPLRSVALVRVHGTVRWRDRRFPGGREPATLAGTLSLSGGREVRLGESNLRLAAARTCPPPE